MAKKSQDDTLIAENRRARHDYEIGETIECGLVLHGAEVKSLRARAVHFTDAYALVDKGQLFLHALKITKWKNASTHEEIDPARPRRLLAKKTEIEKIEKLIKQRGLSVVPLKMYFKGPWAKVLLGIGKGKTHEDKRDTLKEREADRDVARAMRRG